MCIRDRLLAPVLQLVKATPVASFIILALVWVRGASVSYTHLAEGVHVGQEDMAAEQVRARVGEGMMIGVSVHSVEEAREATGASRSGTGGRHRPLLPGNRGERQKHHHLPHSL